LRLVHFNFVEKADRATRRATSVASGLSGFYEGVGIGEPVLSREVIEAYCVIGLRGRQSCTKGTYRSVLRRLAGEPRPRLATPFPGARAKAPYSPGERAELWSMAHGQRSAWRCHSGLAVLCLALGAGLRSSEIVAACGDDVAVSHRGVELVVRGMRERVVPVQGEAGVVLARLSRAVGTAPLFHPEEADRSYPNFVNDFCSQLVGDPSAPRLTVARARSSFVCDHLRNNSSATTSATRRRCRCCSR
jgi:integrase